MRLRTVAALLGISLCVRAEAARNVVLMNYVSRAEAAAAIAGNTTETMVSTGSSVVPYLQLNIFYCNAPAGVVCSATTGPASPIPIQWHEFTTGDAWCRPSYVRQPTSVADCAASYFNRVVPQFKRVGSFTTSERTTVLWWFND